MELWTVQDARMMDDIERDGVYRVRDANTYPYLDFGRGEDAIPEPALLISYLWMADQLRRRTGQAPPPGTRFPIWAWRRQWCRSLDAPNAGKPDMRSWTTNEPEEVVRLKLEIDESRVLLSNFDLWHIPLNRGYASLTREDDDAFDKWYAAHAPEDEFQRDIWDFSKQEPFLREARRRVFKSWELIFELELESVQYDSDWCGNIEDDIIQAVFWEIRSDDIVSAEHFTTRRASRH
ncbi:MAG: hypothetical protein BZ138_06660 [Methanosphaera sp. rholeuAM270]|nr:MAG: hypothetical protein BZ138_06660 [Methanosphaera sp. rholeuAM270]